MNVIRNGVQRDVAWLALLATCTAWAMGYVIVIVGAAGDIAVTTSAFLLAMGALMAAIVRARQARAGSCRRRHDDLAALIDRVQAHAAADAAECARVLAEIDAATRHAHQVADDAVQLAAESSAELMQESLAQYAARDIERRVQQMSVSTWGLQQALCRADAPAPVIALHAGKLVDDTEWLGVRTSSLLIALERSRQLSTQRAMSAEEVACAIGTTRDVINQAHHAIGTMHAGAQDRDAGTRALCARLEYNTRELRHP